MIVDRYYYQQLNQKEKAIYQAFYKGVMSHQDIIPVPAKGKLSDETFNRVFMAMTRDNPLIFFLNQSACSWASDKFSHVAICPQYFFSEKKVKEYKRKIEGVVNQLIADLRLLEGTDYDKEKKVHDWMCQNIEYDFDGSDLKQPVRLIASHNIIGVFAHHKAQCEGIAKAAKVLLNAVDVKCIVATGESDTNHQNERHAWNVVDVEQKPYHLDITWDIGASDRKNGTIAYDYFNLTDEWIMRDHKAEDVLPKCCDLSENYYIKNQLAFNTKAKLYRYIDSALEQRIYEFDFRYNGKEKATKLSGEVMRYILKWMRDQGRPVAKVVQCPNDLLGICKLIVC